MTGVDWLDWALFGLFAAMAAALAALRLSGREVLSHRATGLHVVMAAGMAAMSQPRFDPLPAEAWMVVFAGAAVAAVVVCGRHAPGHAAHHVVGSLFMVVAFAAGHGAHGTEGGQGGPAAGSHRMLDPATGEVVTMAGSSHGPGHSPGHGEGGRSALAGTVGDLAAWPIWPLVGAGFVAYALWLAWGLCGRRYPSFLPGRGTTALRLPDLACGALMAAGMATMAFAL